MSKIFSLFTGEKPRYKIEKELGRGGFGVVLLAYDNVLQRRVALKLISFPEGISKEERKVLVERFFREARAAAGLSHPNIVTIHDISKMLDKYFISMEYLEGEPLSKIISKGPLNQDRALHIAEQVLSALGYAHSMGVIHRDIKPDNIFILPKDRVKLVDFGLARIQTSSTFTGSGIVMGSPGYIAPEVIDGGKADERSDIFSFGVVLYEMLTGTRPFGPNDPFESFVNVIYRVVSKEAEPPSSLVPEISRKLDEVLAKSLSKNPDERFQSTDDFRRSLIEASGIKAEVETVHEESTPERSEEFMYKETYATVDAGKFGEEELRRIEFIPEKLGGLPESRVRSHIRLIAFFLPLSLLLVAGVVFLALFLVGAFRGSDVIVPNVVNLPRENAIKVIRGAGLRVGKIEEVFAYDIWRGKVARQMPEAGTKVPKGTTVDLKVSLGQDVGMVPDVKGKSVTEALSVMKAYGFRVEKRIEKSDSVPPDHVIKTEPEANKLISRSQKVIVYISGK